MLEVQISESTGRLGETTPWRVQIFLDRETHLFTVPGEGYARLFKVAVERMPVDQVVELLRSETPRT